MTTIRKTLKLLFLGTVLVLLSIGYRVFWEKKEKKEGSSERNFLGLQQAKADVVGGGGGGGGGGGNGGGGGGGGGGGCGNSG